MSVNFNSINFLSLWFLELHPSVDNVTFNFLYEDYGSVLPPGVLLLITRPLIRPELWNITVTVVLFAGL